MSLACPNYCPTPSCYSPCSPCDPCGSCNPCDGCSPCGPCGNPCSPCEPCYPLRCCKSRELRASIMMTRCDCTRRNGLQHDCPRSGCQGQPCCMTQPLPKCCPSKFMWRFAYRQMGKPTTVGRCQINPISGIGCNPCVVECSTMKRRCPPCPDPPCPSMPCCGGPCNEKGPCTSSPGNPCCDPCYPTNDGCCGPCFSSCC